MKIDKETSLGSFQPAVFNTSAVAGALPWRLAYFELTKPRLLLMVLLSTFSGFYSGVMAAGGSLSLVLAVLFGTALVGGGSMVVNQYLERDLDGKMSRTRNRPIPSGRIKPKEALIFGISLSLLGFAVFILCERWLSGAVAFFAWAIYLFVYTPLKRKTSLATIIGAVPGALPILIGWTAAKGNLSFECILLFLILFFWQLPHFLALAWIYRNDFARAGLPALSRLEQGELMTARQMTVNVCALIPVSLLATIFHLAGAVYFFGAFAAGICFSCLIVYAAADLTARAHYVFRTSLVYLATILVLLIADKV